MSADNGLRVEHDGADWVVVMWQGDYKGNVISHHKTRDEAIDAANEILQTEEVEYGISYIEQATPKGEQDE